MSRTLILAERIMQIVSVLMLFSAVTFFVYTASADTSAGEPCSTLTNKSAVPIKYGVPYNLFSSAREMLMNITCSSGNKVTVVVGNGDNSLYIYKYGYRKIEGGTWSKITFSGSNVVGPWFVGKAGINLEGVDGENGKVLAYICQQVGGVWKCGCSDAGCGVAKWNIQEYQVAETTDDNEGGDESSIKILDTSHLDFSDPKDIKLLDQYKEEILNGSYEDYFDVQTPSKYVALPGEKLLLTGINFDTTANNDILWNGMVTESNLVSKNGSILTITVPNLTPGKYEIYVRKGTQLTEFPTYIWIGTGTGSVPKITSITPEIGKQGGTFTIYGEGFTNNNDLITTLGILKGLASDDGKTITFTYDPFDRPTTFYTKQGEKQNVKMPISVTVINTSGLSNSGNFNLDL